MIKNTYIRQLINLFVVLFAGAHGRAIFPTKDLPEEKLSPGSVDTPTDELSISTPSERDKYYEQARYLLGTSTDRDTGYVKLYFDNYSQYSSSSATDRERISSSDNDEYLVRKDDHRSLSGTSSGYGDRSSTSDDSDDRSLYSSSTSGQHDRCHSSISEDPTTNSTSSSSDDTDTYINVSSDDDDSSYADAAKMHSHLTSPDEIDCQGRNYNDVTIRQRVDDFMRRNALVRLLTSEQTSTTPSQSVAMETPFVSTAAGLETSRSYSVTSPESRWCE